MRTKSTFTVLFIAALFGGITSPAFSDDPDTLGAAPQYWAILEAEHTRDLAKDPMNAFSHHTRGCLRDNLKNYDGAIADFTFGITGKALQDNPRETYLTYSFRGRTWNKKQEPLRAIVDAFAGCASEQNTGLAWSVRADAWYAMGNFEEAQKCLTNSLHHDSRRPRNYTKEGAHINALTYGKTHKSIDMAMSIDIEPKFDAAIAAQNAGKIDEAIAAYTEITELSPLDGTAWGNRGILHANAGRLDAAIADYSTGIAAAFVAKNTVNQINGLKNRSLIYSQQHRYVEEIVDLELALKLSKGDAEATAALKIAREKFASIPSSDPKLKAAEDNHEVAKQKKSKG